MALKFVLFILVVVIVVVAVYSRKPHGHRFDQKTCPLTVGGSCREHKPYMRRVAQPCLLTYVQFLYFATL